MGYIGTKFADSRELFLRGGQHMRIIESVPPLFGRGRVPTSRLLHLLLGVYS